MKTSNIFLVLFFTVFMSFYFTTTPFAIIHSVHNLTRQSGVVTQNDEICIYCHSPHVDDITVIADYNPLWSGDVQTSTSFEPYAANNRSFTFDGVVGDPLVGPTRLCISCHDGTIAVDSALAASLGTRFIVPRRMIGDGATLASDHPVGFDYVAAAATDNEIRPATTAFANGTIADYLFTSGTQEIMTCATCHDVHTYGPGWFLRVDNTGSALCLSCHIK